MALPRRVALAALPAAVLTLLLLIGALAIAAPADQAQLKDTPSVGGLDDLHEAGYTGENVTVGIVDVTGFDRDDPAIADQVAAARAFGPGATVAQGGHSDHGTAAAAVVADTAPDADLYLASFETQGGYQRAVQWLLANDVDVVVAPVSFYGTPGDGSTRTARVATDAVRQDTVFVAAAGNLAEGHWETRYDSVADGRLVVAEGSSTDSSDGTGDAATGDDATDDAGDGSTGDPARPATTRNYLRGEGGHVTVWLSWDEAHADEEYAVELYRSPGDPTAARSVPERVAVSRNFSLDEVPNQRLEADVESGRYFVVVRGPDRPTGARLRLASPTHDFQYATPAGSLVAPATADEVVSVGAFDTDGGRVEPFSSRGPTPDNRLGVDVVAPARHDVTDGPDPYAGTSAASAYVGGVAALLRDADPDRSPRSIEHALEATAVDVARPGPDPIAGYGRIDPYRAVRAFAVEAE